MSYLVLEMEKCHHKLDWDNVWLPAKLYIKEIPNIVPATRVLPLSKYWRGICLNCKEEITEMDIPYEKK